MLHRIKSIAPFALFALALLPLAACTSDDDEGDDELGETESGESDSTDGGTTDTDPAETTSTDGSSAEGVDSTDGGDSTDGDTTDSTDTGTTGDPSLNEELCTQLCAVYGECTFESPGCLEACLEEHDALQGECLGDEQALTACVAGLTCDELLQYWDGSPEPYPCQAEQAEAQACQDPNPGDDCAAVGSSWSESDCSFQYSCPNAAYLVECTAEGCSCFEDGVEVGGCSEAAQFCAGLEVDLANACCGWQL